jgi:Flp pilus assembly protein TadG
MMMNVNKASWHRAARRAALRADKKGSTAVLLAVALPGLILVAAMLNDLSSWSSASTQIHQIATTAALAGAENYNITTNAQQATKTAASVAQANGVSGASNPTWTAETNTLTSNKIVAQLVSGSVSPSEPAVKVTVSSTLPPGMASMVSNSGPTITTTATAEVIQKQIYNACIVALDPVGAGTGFTDAGSAVLDATGCVVLSNANQSFGGSASATADSYVAAGSITVGNAGTVTGTQIPNSGVTRDPYATSSNIVNAFAALSPGSNTGGTISVNNGNATTIAGGTYASFRLTGGVLTLSPGAYYVNGDISMSGGSQITGTGVTVVVAGAVSMTGNSFMTLSAASTGSANGGAIPAVVLTGNGTQTQTIGGTNSTMITGVIYFPNALVYFSGTSTTNTSNGCLQIWAASVTLQGNPELAPSCRSMGALAVTNTHFNKARVVK